MASKTPKWVQDEESKKCMRCMKDFSVLNRRHHCRKCGFLVCKGCSPHKLQISGSIPVRVCSICFAGLIDSDNSETLQVIQAGSGILTLHESANLTMKLSSQDSFESYSESTNHENEHNGACKADSTFHNFPGNFTNDTFQSPDDSFGNEETHITLSKANSQATMSHSSSGIDMDDYEQSLALPIFDTLLTDFPTPHQVPSSAWILTRSQYCPFQTESSRRWLTENGFSRFFDSEQVNRKNKHSESKADAESIDSKDSKKRKQSTKKKTDFESMIIQEGPLCLLLHVQVQLSSEGNSNSVQEEKSHHIKTFFTEGIDSTIGHRFGKFVQDILSRDHDPEAKKTDKSQEQNKTDQTAMPTLNKSKESKSNLEDKPNIQESNTIETQKHAEFETRTRSFSQTFVESCSSEHTQENTQDTKCSCEQFGGNIEDWHWFCLLPEADLLWSNICKKSDFLSSNCSLDNIVSTQMCENPSLRQRRSQSSPDVVDQFKADFLSPNFLSTASQKTIRTCESSIQECKTQFDGQLAPLVNEFRSLRVNHAKLTDGLAPLASRALGHSDVFRLAKTRFGIDTRNEHNPDSHNQTSGVQLDKSKQWQSCCFTISTRSDILVLAAPSIGWKKKWMKTLGFMKEHQETELRYLRRLALHPEKVLQEPHLAFSVLVAVDSGEPQRDTVIACSPMLSIMCDPYTADRVFDWLVDAQVKHTKRLNKPHLVNQTDTIQKLVEQKGLTTAPNQPSKQVVQIDLKEPVLTCDMFEKYASMLNSVGKEQTIWEEFRDELQLPIDEILIKMDEYVRDIHQVRSNNIHNIYYGKLFLTQRYVFFQYNQQQAVIAIPLCSIGNIRTCKTKLLIQRDNGIEISNCVIYKVHPQIQVSNLRTNPPVWEKLPDTSFVFVFSQLKEFVLSRGDEREAGRRSYWVQAIAELAAAHIITRVWLGLTDQDEKDKISHSNAELKIPNETMQESTSSPQKQDNKQAEKDHPRRSVVQNVSHFLSQFKRYREKSDVHRQRSSFDVIDKRNLLPNWIALNLIRSRALFKATGRLRNTLHYCIHAIKSPLGTEALVVRGVFTGHLPKQEEFNTGPRLEIFNFRSDDSLSETSEDIAIDIRMPLAKENQLKDLIGQVDLSEEKIDVSTWLSPVLRFLSHESAVQQRREKQRKQFDMLTLRTEIEIFSDCMKRVAAVIAAIESIVSWDVPQLTLPIFLVLLSFLWHDLLDYSFVLLFLVNVLLLLILGSVGSIEDLKIQSDDKDKKDTAKKGLRKTIQRYEKIQKKLGNLQIRLHKINQIMLKIQSLYMWESRQITLWFLFINILLALLFLFVPIRIIVTTVLLYIFVKPLKRQYKRMQQLMKKEEFASSVTAAVTGKRKGSDVFADIQNMWDEVVNNDSATESETDSSDDELEENETDISGVVNSNVLETSEEAQQLNVDQNHVLISNSQAPLGVQNRQLKRSKKQQSLSIFDKIYDSIPTPKT